MRENSIDTAGVLRMGLSFFLTSIFSYNGGSAILRKLPSVLFSFLDKKSILEELI